MKQFKETEFSTITNNNKVALERLFNKHSELEYLKNEIEYVVENDIRFTLDETSNVWKYAIYFNKATCTDKINCVYYISIVERI